jgi:hypothetical protein
MKAVIGDAEVVSDFVIRFDYVNSLVSDVSEATVRHLFLSSLKPRKELFRRLTDAI